MSWQGRQKNVVQSINKKSTNEKPQNKSFKITKYIQNLQKNLHDMTVRLKTAKNLS